MSKSAPAPGQSVGLVIFDCDGVLVDSEPIANRVLAGALTDAGYPVTVAECERRFTGRTYRAVVEMVEAERRRLLPPGFSQEVQERTISRFATELRPIAGVAEIIPEVAVPKCVASSSSPRWIRAALETTGLLGLFEPHLFSAAMVAEGKPAPDLFLYAAEEMGVEPLDCLVIEDSVAGIAAARAAGMRVLGFAGGGHAGASDYIARLEREGAEAVFRDAATLGTALGRILK